MLYQGIITLLSTLLGGLLAITGSSIANHYNHKKILLLERRKEKLERRKEKRNILESVYASILNVENMHLDFFTSDGKEANLKIIMQSKNELDKIVMQIYLYVPELGTETLEFIEKMQWNGFLLDHMAGRLTFEEFTKKTVEDVFTASKNYRTCISNFIQSQNSMLFVES